MITALIAGTLLGLASAPHCVLMCGPLTLFASVDRANVAVPSATLLYQCGRVLGYAGVGAIAGTLGVGLTAFVPFEAEAIFSVTLALALTLAAFRSWPRSTLVSLRRRAPFRLTVPLRLASASAAFLARLPRKPFVLGTASALLPCGVLASGALLAASSGGSLSGAAVMIGLAFGSGLALVVGAFVLGRVDLSANRHAAMALSLLLFAGALVLASRPLLTTDDGASCHTG